MAPKPNLIIVSTTKLGVSLLSHLTKNHKIAAVITDKTNINVIKNAKCHKIKCFLFEKKNKKDSSTLESAIRKAIAKVRNAIIIVAGCPIFIPESVWKKHKTINIHPSYLPEFRGPYPIHAALKAKKSYLGITVSYITKKADSGNILVQEKFPLARTQRTFRKAYTLFLRKAPKLAETAINLAAAGNKGVKQKGKVSYAGNK